MGSPGIEFYGNYNNVTYFDSFGVGEVQCEIKEFIVNKDLIANTSRIQVNDLMIGRYFYIVFIDFTLKNKSLISFWHLFLTSKNFKEHYKNILSHSLKNIKWLMHLLMELNK